ncbi:M23 family metallopeptidase [Amphiplicatus metriothermophilus]|uniref:Murein DD-endopeptidase MepM and murein hydrolase activator NlpD, contain LysM domain n=1 Tax=Amphiplicatus metriothermophilus TaxID=1519374 RepID=A0A239PZZ2_9PROT|nr:M23 family metallopeptidase [Amphiplicatus metriothermophilus]MBB5520170.1 murein DD-endopeptidase MepM/ murein hydrolase activator NlpD [Amphiplicatus metriothermophilus]SNT75919.1 Murein DD-endopeptidase MepM and murein hydrolase activator NlpD, contain LysM domain [Amphiplicatus metriothermophilus]
MSRRSGRVKRIISRLFKERQIYHRSDGVVHFISMSTRTQIALAGVIGTFLLWVAYASVNVVFKEQIIVAKERDARIMETTYAKQLLKQQRAYDDVHSLNVIMQREFDATMAEISSRHQTLKSMVERKVAIDQSLDGLARGLSEAGAPNGAKPANANRVMIDVAPAEATPRQSRLSILRRQALEEVEKSRAAAPPGSAASEALKKMESAAVDLYIEQMLLVAALEEKATAKIDTLHRVLAATGIGGEELLPDPKITNMVLAQGGPFIHAANFTDASTAFFRHANRAGVLIDELATLEAVVARLPLSSPLTVSRRLTSGFGVRRDPITGRNANHFGVDFSAAWASPVTATASGVVVYAGVKNGWGRVVEVDHGNGFMTRYAHLHRISVKRGQKVALHQKVGELGSSGRSTGPHVHYEVLYKGRPKNPRRFMEAGRYVFES